MKKLVLFAAAVLGLFLSFGFNAAQAEDYQYKSNALSVGVWSTNINGTVQYKGTPLDVTGTLGLNKQSSVLLDLKLKLGKRWNLFAKYYNLDYKATQNPTATFIFDGKTYTVGTDITSQIRFNVNELFLAPELYRKDNSYLAFLFGSKNVSAYTQISNSLVGSSTYSIAVGIPEVGLKGEFAMGKNLNFFAEARGLSINSNGTTGSTLDYDLGFNYGSPTGMGINLGYKYSKLNAKNGNNQEEADLSYYGPHLDLQFKF